MRWMIVMAALLLTACGNAVEQPITNAHTGADAAPETVSADVYEADTYEDVSFEDVLAEFQALNARLESVSYDIRRANAGLCPETVRDVGFTTHVIGDYPSDLQPMAGELLGASERISIRTVRADSPADKAGLRPADQLLRVNDQGIPSGITSMTMYRALKARAFEENRVAFKFRRGSADIMDLEISPETICAYPSNIFFSERVNGHTNGEEVWITSELMRTFPDDIQLALVIAHEMAHAIAGHQNTVPTKELELEADRMGLIMLARAGYDIDAAVEFWQTAAHPHGDRVSSDSHPSMGERLNNFRQTQLDIKTALKEGRNLTF